MTPLGLAMHTQQGFWNRNKLMIVSLEMPPYPPFPLRSPNRKAYSQAQEDNLGNSSHSGLVLGFYAMPSIPAAWKRRSVTLQAGSWALPVLCICMWQMQFLGRCEGWSSSLPGRKPPGSWC